MKISRLGQKGFGAFGVLLVIIFLAGAGYGGYYVYLANKQADAKLNGTAIKPVPRDSGLRRATADWTSYSSTEGLFSLKYPKTWVRAANPELCSPGILLLGPNENSVGHCATEDFGQISVMSTEGDIRDEKDCANDPSFKNVRSRNVTVSGVQGKRVEATAGPEPIRDGEEQIIADPFPEGTKVVRYLFFTNNRTYVATYVQDLPGANYRDVLEDFDLMARTLKFKQA